MLILMRKYANKAYIFLKEDDNKFSEVSIHYKLIEDKNTIYSQKGIPV
jgi:hypothetical protein